MSKRMTDEEIRELAATAETCVCGALIEEIDSGQGWSFWAHVKRTRIDYDHSAVPATSA